MSDGKKAWGRTLEEFQTIEESFAIEGLYPAEHGLMEACVLGRFYICEGYSDKRPIAADPEKNLIRGDFLRFLILGGDGQTPIDGKGVQLLGAWVECGEGDEGKALDIEGHIVDHDILLGYCHLDGQIIARGAVLQTLNLGGSSVEGIIGDGLKTSRDVFLDKGFEAKGMVRLLGAEIGGDLDCTNGRFLGEDISIDCDGMKVGGHGLFYSANKTMQVKGRLDLIDAEFGRGLTFQKALFTSAKNNIDAPGLKVGSELQLQGAQFAGAVSLTNARIGGDVTTEYASFNGGLAIERTKVEGILFWRKLKHFAGHLSFDQSRIEALSFDPPSWQKPASIDLDGLVYERFHKFPNECDGHYWRDQFLGAYRIAKDYPIEQNKGRFHPFAHGQLAKVLNAMGHEEEARAINIEKRRLTAQQERKQLCADSSVLERLTVLWNIITGFTIDYGYRPGKAFLWMLALGAVGAFISQLGANHGLMGPTDPLIYRTHFHGEDRGEVYAICQKNWTKIMCAPILPAEHSEFSAPAYSFDVLLPIINFRQQEDWAPRVVDEKGNRLWSGWWMRNWEWLQTGLGWLLSLLLVSGVTGMIRRE